VKPVSSFLRAVNEQTDDCILTDQEVYELKGGDKGLASKIAFGLTISLTYLIATRRYKEFLHFNVNGIFLFF